MTGRAVGDTSISPTEPEPQLDRIEQLLRELHRDLRMLKQEIAMTHRLIERVAGRE